MLVKLAEAFSVSTDYLLGREDRRYLEITGLSDEEISHIQVAVEDLRARR